MCPPTLTLRRKQIKFPKRRVFCCERPKKRMVRRQWRERGFTSAKDDRRCSACSDLVHYEFFPRRTHSSPPDRPRIRERWGVAAKARAALTRGVEKWLPTALRRLQSLPIGTFVSAGVRLLISVKQELSEASITSKNGREQKPGRASIILTARCGRSHTFKRITE
jgi:hypothetical protein